MVLHQLKNGRIVNIGRYVKPTVMWALETTWHAEK